MFDRSFLPVADIEFVVLSDTHYCRIPKNYAQNKDDTRRTGDWSERAAQAINLAASLEADFTIHLGDLVETHLAGTELSDGRAEARAQFDRYGLKPYFVAGNMDIGDKPNSTVPADWVRPDDLEEWHSQFGTSWYSFDKQDVHFVFLNTQIIGSELPEANLQQQWLESDLADNLGRRIFVFMHIPLFTMERFEPGFGSYNCLDEPARNWLIDLFCDHKVEAVFTGHTHFAAYNRLGPMRIYGVPSTTFSRPGFNEVFPVLPEHRGKNDIDKLGFYLARVHSDGVRMHIIRTNGETAESLSRRKRLVTRTSLDLPESPLGVYLRHPLAPVTGGVHAWPDAVRQHVRNDYPLLACMELGVRYLRTLASDLYDHVQLQRLIMAQDEGMHLTFVWLWSEVLDLSDAIDRTRTHIGTVELQIPSGLLPSKECMDTLSEARERGMEISVAPFLPRQLIPGKHYTRNRIGYRVDELAELDQHLTTMGMQLDRAVCQIDGSNHPWDQFAMFSNKLPLRQISHLDFIVQFSGFDEISQADLAAESLFASAKIPGCRLYYDPFTDVDRSTDTSNGLLDRLSNPRPAFHAIRCLNTILYGSCTSDLTGECEETKLSGRILRLIGKKRCLELALPNATLTINLTGSDNANIEINEHVSVDLKTGTSELIQ